ncbi:hypothetical protein [Sulfitobacter sp. R86518]|uniref:hypothetical protein n=1 Tax=Sulfitobacter sp. R86518 TaxID=3093858 RepID=UPI0036DE1009
MDQVWSIRYARRLFRDHLAMQRWWPRGPSLLSAEAFRGRRIILIGPADTVLEDLADTNVDDYDYVIRFNNGIELSKRHPEIMGCRTDILFHNLRETGERSAGAIPGSYLNENGVKLVVYPHWRTSRLRNLYLKKRAVLAREGGPPIKLLPPLEMRQLRADLGDRAPTIGTCASLFFLASPAAEVALHGFTFFETAYVLGYNGAVKNAADARAWVDQGGAHEPLSEKTLLRHRLKESDVAKVVLGTNVRRYLYADR